MPPKKAGRVGGKKKKGGKKKAAKLEAAAAAARAEIRTGRRLPVLRFAQGARVECRVDDDGMCWAGGVVVALHYRERNWHPARDPSAPYQVQLDDGRLIFAPNDDDEIIRAEGGDGGGGGGGGGKKKGRGKKKKGR